MNDDRRLSIDPCPLTIVQCRWLLAATALVAALFVTGCGPREKTWGERTSAENRVFLVDGREDRCLIYRDNGPRDAPLTLVCLHGMGGSKFAWHALSDALDDTYRVISLDLLGHGDSSKPEFMDYSMSMHGRLVGQLIRKLRLRNVVLVGHSYGGGIALEAALPHFSVPPAAPQTERQSGQETERQVERQAAGCIRALVLLAPGALEFAPPETLRNATDPLRRWLIVTLGTGARVCNILERRAYWRPERVSPACALECVRIYDSRAARVSLASSARAMFQELHARRDDRDRYAAINCPVLLLYGEHDAAIPRDMIDRLAAQLPAEQLAIIPETGHCAMEESPGFCIAHIAEFLAGLRDTARR